MPARRKALLRGKYLHWTRGMTKDLVRMWPRKSAREIGEILSDRYDKDVSGQSCSGKARYIGMPSKAALKQAQAQWRAG